MTYPFINPPLPYGYGDLEPQIDEQTMHLHHDKHLQTYVDNLNKTIEPYPTLQTSTLTQLITSSDALPPNIRTAVKNNAGGVYNHIFFFDGLCGLHKKRSAEDKIYSDGKVSPAVLHFLERDFGSFDEFKKQFTAAATGVFGSGYAWLCLNRSGRLMITTTANQDNPMTQSLRPILNFDVWEHAYYLKYHNVRADYIKNLFSVIDWNTVEERLSFKR